MCVRAEGLSTRAALVVLCPTSEKVRSTMARPLRSWPSPPPLSHLRRTSRVCSEPLESRQLLSASLVSIDSTGFSSGNGASSDPDISTNGRFVVFVSTSTNLLDQDQGAGSDIYL